MPRKGLPTMILQKYQRPSLAYTYRRSEAEVEWIYRRAEVRLYPLRTPIRS